MQKVWFQLVDVDGNDLSSAFYVKIENDEDIVGFLKDVKKDYTNKLTHVDAGDLIVYANRATFNTDALIVVVPMQAQQNMERDAKKQKVEETPDIWMKVLADERVDILPLDREALQLHLERELREKIPIAEKDAIQMKTHSVPNVVVLKSSDLKKKHVVLAPVGLIAPPTDVKQLVTALHDILTALVALHKLGLMHRDLRYAVL
ncbi:hypothetical protein JM18_007995 [Phytophthora kernoviae]|uniref:Protein kinase domain-containing protein n=2 Tax=Phytophthora kernoviae TaxID=325452 RepID=A0A8T0LNM2_9STRA|nr:hypothetical protein G195_009395 [Phytophthora kernoviae 00238/432]KAG2512870.1 hypothetical protein JM16_008036 [Phytophthora kernoviae]KAG2516562.1 hypothetical protein JM18_007995 [Phytophthora kernoviae]